MADERRTNPDELLKSIKKSEKREGRGKLRVFLGMCPGVGKTYSMLRGAQDQVKSGIDVVVGFVETHQRKETEALLDNLRVMPRKETDHKGSLFTEFDLDAALALKPKLILVDELAHTNAPGSRHQKRYQDVEELLESGINVYTTVNVQHIESRADLVQEITGAVVRETVPDSFLEQADQIELVDLSPDELIKRLKDGKVYLGDRAERALQNFFKLEHLTALREIALRFIADRVDLDLKDQMLLKGITGPWRANERLLVAVSHSPYSSRLIRATRRMAYSMEAPWIALYVNNDERLQAVDQAMLAKNLNLAKELGAELVTTRDSNIAAALKRIALEKNVTQIVMGRPDRRFFRDIIARGTILDQLVRETSGIDVHVIRQERKPIFRGFHIPWPTLTSGFIPYWFVLCFFLGLTLFSYLMKEWVGYRVLSFVFLAGVLVVSSMASPGPILFAAAISALVWNFFFIPPTFTFAIGSTEDIMMCLAYFFVASVAGYLTTRIRRQEADLLQREQRSNILYELGRDFAEAQSLGQIANCAERCIRRIFLADTAILLGESDQKISNKPLNITSIEVSEKDVAVATWSYLNRKPAGLSTDTLSSSRCFSLPLLGKNGAIGVMLLFPKADQPFLLSIEQQNLLETIANNLAVVLEREQFMKQARKSQMLQESEKLHQALLNSVSHELRTPLTSIIGASTALQDPKTAGREDVRSTLTEELILSAERLNRVVENLLDMSRLSSGVLSIRREIFDCNDFVRETVRRSSRMLKNHSIELELCPRDLFCEGDDRLLEHCLFNLLLNATAYSPAGSKIWIRTSDFGGRVRLEVLDEGSGFPPDSLDKIFEKFYRAPGSPPGGTGLGLSIAKSIIESHGGRIKAANRSDRTGAILCIDLPMVDLPRGLVENEK